MGRNSFLEEYWVITSEEQLEKLGIFEEEISNHQVYQNRNESEEIPYLNIWSMQQSTK